MVYKTIGSTGDFPTIVTAWAWCVANSPLTDDFTFTIIEDITETTYSSNTFTLTGNHTFKITTNLNHYGNPNAGRKVYMAQGAQLGFTIRRSASINKPSFILENINFIKSQANLIQINTVFFDIAGGANPYVYNVDIHNLIFNGNGKTISGDIALNGTWQSTSGETITIKTSNIKLFNWDTGLNFIAITANDVPGTIENCSIYGCKIGIIQSFLGTKIFLKNVVSCAGGIIGAKSYLCTSGTNNNFTNCADDDGLIPAGTGNIHNIIPSTEFESLVYTNENLLRLKKGSISATPSPTPNKGLSPLVVKFKGNEAYTLPSGGKLYNSGAVPTLSSTDISGNAYGNWGFYPIGCHNVEIAY